MICSKCRGNINIKNELHYVNNFWYFVPVYYCINCGSFINEDDICDKNKCEPLKSIRKYIRKGLHVKIVLKKDQKTGILTEGYVQDILTNSEEHWRGIKVRLTSGDVGRVQFILPD